MNYLIILMKTKVSITTLFIVCLLVSAATFGIAKFAKKEKPVTQVPISECATTMEQIRLKNYELVEPLIMVDLINSSTSLIPVQRKIEDFIATSKSNQRVEDVSVYLRRLNDGAWLNINPNRTYNPASMSKIIYLITYLKEAEYNPKVLDKKIFFARHFADGNQQNIVDFRLTENVNYSVKDLMIYMIKYSDNDATMLLSQNMNLNIYNQIFKDLSIPTPPKAGEYYITAIDYSKFFRVLYNASYIRPEYSDFGLKLLTQSTYKDGLLGGIDSTVTVAHKFGERIIGNKAQLHEFGIVFIKGDPYLLGIMTVGSSLKQQSEIVAEISRITYTEFLKLNHSS